MLELMGYMLRYLHSNDAINLLRHSFAIPKMLYILRTSPCFASPLLQDYDCLLCQILEKICSISFGGNDTSWLQATLSINIGGLVILSAVHLAPSAILTSADESLKLVQSILPSRLLHTPYQEREEALHHWGFGQEDEFPLPPASHRQKAWVGFASAAG